MGDSDSSISCASDFMIPTKKYNKCHTHQASFEENIVDLMMKAYIPLSLVDCRKFRNLISLLDLRIVTVLRSIHSRNLIPLNYEAVESNVMKMLNNFPYVFLRFDLWISVKNKKNCNICPSFIQAKNGTTTLACPAQMVYIRRLTLSLTQLLSLFWREKLASHMMVELI